MGNQIIKMIHRTKKSEVANYYDNDNLSQSKIKLLLSNVNLYNAVTQTDLYYNEKTHFVIGSAVDCWITEGEEVFDNTYYISKLGKKPSDVVMSIVEEVFDKIEKNEVKSLDNYFDLIKNSCNSHNYYDNRLDESKVNTLVKQGKDYFNELRNSNKRQILSEEEYKLIKDISENLLTNEYTKKYFEDSVGKDIIYQLPLYFKYCGVECKALLDMVIIDHFKKEIILCDIKTLGDYTSNFPKSSNKRRYDIQAAFYIQALIESGSKVESIISKSIEGYKVVGFRFIVESTLSPGNPLVFKVVPDLLIMGKLGRPHVTFSKKEIPPSGIQFNKIPGFEYGISLYKWYQEHGFETEKIISINEGELEFDWYGIIEN